MSNGESAEAGAATVVSAALVATSLALAVIVADIGMVLRVRSQVAAAADAGALAAAPLTFQPGGAEPGVVAADFVMRNGATLMRCDCPVDRTWSARTVTVVAAATAGTMLAGEVTLAVSSRAEFVPTAQFAGDG